MANPLKKFSNTLFNPGGLIGPPRFPTDTSRGREYSRLRYGALTVPREQVGIPAPPPDLPVWVALMETGHPQLTETVVLVSDGSSSVYMSNGDGFRGGHGYENVKKANAEFIRLVNRDRQHFQAAADFPVPEVGSTLFYARTDAGLLVCGGTQQALIEGQHVLAELFQAGHEAITQMHIAGIESQANLPGGQTSREYFKSGTAYAAQGDFYRAIAAYNKSIERNPGYPDAYLQRGIAYGALGNFDHALAEFNQALELAPHDPYIYMNRANVYKFKKERDRVVADYDKAIDLKRDFAEAYLERGLFYQSLEDNGEAVQDYQRFLAISTDPQMRKRVEEELKKLG
jgi:tetratricopeptide (TPR) repeat protein